MSEFAHRGVIEGFYGPQYSHADRLWLIERLGSWGMNRYVHAPKDDPLHRARWRDPYEPAALAEFGELVERGGAAGVTVGFALSPGLTIEYGSADDVRALQAKFRGFRDVGARFFSLALDDVPSTLMHHGDGERFGSLAAAHVALTHAVAEAIGPDAMLWLVPTDYVGVAATDYLDELGEKLDASIEVGWTGRTVLSPTILDAEARQRAATLRRRLLVWDNLPVADGPMRPMLHLAPYRGRDTGLAEHVSGFLLNPMDKPHASGVTVRTAADYLRDPAGYDPEAAWRDAIAELGTGAPEAFGLFAAAHRFAPQSSDDHDAELAAALVPLREAVASDDAGAAAAAVRIIQPMLEARVAAAETVRANLTDRSLVAEIEPWLAAHKVESERMTAAVDLLELLFTDAHAMQRVFGFLRLEGMLSRLPLPSVASYGPRRVLYPQLASMRDDGAGFGADQVLFVDRNLADSVVAMAEEAALARLVAIA